MKTSEQTKLVYSAVIKAQPKFKNAVKGADNPFHKSKYADMESVLDAVREELAANELGFVQLTKLDPNFVCVLVTRIIHTSGEWIEGEYPIKPIKDDPQALKAAITYARRSALEAALGVKTSDDDGESGMDREGADRPASKREIVEIMKAFNGIGVSQAQVLKYLGIADETKVLVKDVEKLWEIGKEIHSKKSTVASYFGA